MRSIIATEAPGFCFDQDLPWGKRDILLFVGLIATTESSPQPLAAAAAKARPGLIADYATLFKVRVSAMVMITAAAGFYLGSLRSGISPFNAGMVRALFGIAVVTCGSSALNQVLERSTDRLMLRTRNRPMAAGRIGLAHGLIVGFVSIFGGSLFLARATNPLTGILTLLTAVGYVAIYTPLKRFSTINTFIGAFPGALPPLLGWTAARGVIEWPGVALFLILFLWQFPHFMAIAWMYREDYDRAGYLVLPKGNARIPFVALETLLPLLALVAISMAPLPTQHAATFYCAGALLGLGFLYFGLTFVLQRSRSAARRLLAASIVYLPLFFALSATLCNRGRS